MQLQLQANSQTEIDNSKGMLVWFCCPMDTPEVRENINGLVSALSRARFYVGDGRYKATASALDGIKVHFMGDECVEKWFGQIIKGQLLQYSALTGEEVNLNLNDPDNILNSTAKFTSSTPFYLKRLGAPDMSVSTLMYRATTVDRGILFDGIYPTNPPTPGNLGSAGKPFGDLLKELLTSNPNTDPTTLLQTIADTLTATQTTANNTANNQANVTQLLTDLVAKGGDAAILQQLAEAIAAMSQVADGVDQTATNTANNQANVTQLLTDLVAKGGDAVILQKIDVSLANMATLGQDIKDMNTLYAQKLTDLINELKANGGSESDINQLSTMLESMKTIQAMAGAVSATAMTAEAAAEWAQLGLQSVDSAIEATKLGLDASMATVELADKATDEIRDLVVGVGAIATGVGTIGTAIGTVMGALTNAVGFYAVRNAIVGVRGELEKLNANIGGPANGDGWFAWLKYQFWGGEPPASYKPTLNDIASAQLQATREINDSQGGNTDLNVEDSIQYIGNGNGSSHK